MNDYQRIAELIEQGRKIEAIKQLREATGIGLAEAREQVERLSAEAAGQPRPAERPDLDTPGLPEDVLALARSGQKLEAIKLLRERTGLGLKEAKEQVEAQTDTANNPRAFIVVAVAVVVLVVMGVLMALGL